MQDGSFHYFPKLEYTLCTKITKQYIIYVNRNRLQEPYSRDLNTKYKLYLTGNETAGRCWFFRTAYSMNFHDDLIFQDISLKWRTVRKYVGNYIKKHSDGEVQQYEKMMSELCSMLVDSIKADVTTSGCNDLDPYEHLYLFIVNGLSSLISGRTYSSTDDPTFQTWIQMERLSIK